MSTSSLAATVSDVFTSVVGTDPPRGLETTPDDVAEWDSLAHVHVVFALEQDLDVRLPESVLVTRSSLGALVEEVERALDGR
jgi:acyl carrier protein